MSVEVTETTFAQQVEASPVPVVLEFYATWCGNCRRIAATVEGLAGEFAETVRFVKVNADRAPSLVARFAVSSTPTLIVLNGDEQVAQVVGAQPEPVLRNLFETAAAAGTVLAASAAESWVPTDACTLPTAEQPLRLAEFDVLFRSLSGVRREEPGWLRLRLDGGEAADRVAGLARELTAKEAACCSFFAFAVAREGSEVIVDVRVPADRAVVLDGLTAQAQAARAAA
ncbi:thioredoxin family protein [Allokutzneria oryzae]|uniref:Thioredoxin family protein n=1 Tax=Allokutzneria oryzae TaxID=1378989 RepID=A0ABV5ZYI6_9PSEU